MADGPLQALRVLDLSQGIAGAFCTKILADYGADVLKVEPAGTGDALRAMGPFYHDTPGLETGGLHLYLDLNKRSVTLDRSTATGEAILRALLPHFDAVVANEPAGDGLEGLKPPIWVTLTPFGLEGPYAGHRASDLVLWALSGLLQNSGFAGREPIRIGRDVSEYVTGLYGAVSLLALRAARMMRREASGPGPGARGPKSDAFGPATPASVPAPGPGRRAEVAALEALQSMAPTTVAAYQYREDRALTPRASNTFPMPILPCRDGFVGFYVPLQYLWESLTVLVEMPELREDPRFATPLSRMAHVPEITEAILPWFLAHDQEEIFRRGQELRVPIAPVPNTAQILNFEQHRARGYFREIDHPVTGPLTYLGLPFQLSASPPPTPRPAPALGQDNAAVYCGLLGLAPEELVVLRDTGVI